MARLTAMSVKALNQPGRYGDGNGLYLLIDKRGGKSWMVRVQKNGRRRDIGLGSESKVSLKLARERAAQARSQIEAGIDPVAERKRAAGIPTFREAAALVHAEHKRGWKNGKHQAQWLSTLNAYAFPSLGDVSVASIDAPMVRDVLAAIWLAKPETARRLRQRICTVIDWAVAKGYREASLPMPVIDKALPRQRDKVKHHPALPFAAMPEFMQDLRRRESVGRLALEALILTAVRSGDLRGMKWSEIDLDNNVWSVPVEDGRGKGGRVHTVPLSSQMLDLLRRAKPYRRGDSELVFPGTKRGKPLSDMTLCKVIRDMHEASIKAGEGGYVDQTENRVAVAHGFRSSFADWVTDKTNFSTEVREAALAHVNPNKVTTSYTRTDYLDKRREVMSAWGDYCLGRQA